VPDPVGYGRGADDEPDADVGGRGGLGAEAEADAEPAVFPASAGAIANSRHGTATKRMRAGARRVRGRMGPVRRRSPAGDSPRREKRH